MDSISVDTVCPYCGFAFTAVLKRLADYTGSPKDGDMVYKAGTKYSQMTNCENPKCNLLIVVLPPSEPTPSVLI